MFFLSVFSCFSCFFLVFRYIYLWIYGVLVCVSLGVYFSFSKKNLSFSYAFAFFICTSDKRIVVTTNEKGCNLWSLKTFLVTFIFSFIYFVWILHCGKEQQLNNMEFNNKMKRRNILTFKDKSFMYYLGSNLLNFLSHFLCLSFCRHNRLWKMRNN